MPSTDDLIAHLKSLPDRPARYAWLDGLDRPERNAILNTISNLRLCSKIDIIEKNQTEERQFFLMKERGGQLSVL